MIGHAYAVQQITERQAQKWAREDREAREAELAVAESQRAYLDCLLQVAAEKVGALRFTVGELTEQNDRLRQRVRDLGGDA